MKKVDLAYTAGIIDGEGCVQIQRRLYPRRVTYLSLIEVSNTNRKILEWLHQHFGGYLKQFKRKKIFSPKAKPQWVWSITQKTGLKKFAGWMLHYSILKHEQLGLVLAFLDKEIDDEVAFKKMKVLNHRGV